MRLPPAAAARITPRLSIRTPTSRFLARRQEAVKEENSVRAHSSVLAKTSFAQQCTGESWAFILAITCYYLLLPDFILAQDGLTVNTPPQNHIVAILLCLQCRADSLELRPISAFKYTRDEHCDALNETNKSISLANDKRQTLQISSKKSTASIQDYQSPVLCHHHTPLPIPSKTPSFISTKKNPPKLSRSSIVMS